MDLVFVALRLVMHAETPSVSTGLRSNGSVGQQYKPTMGGESLLDFSQLHSFGHVCRFQQSFIAASVVVYLPMSHAHRNR